jgi:SAM-dependent methyltransferase
VPPRRLAAEVGRGDFTATGDEFFELFRRAGLEPDDDVLDVGCGAGRMARPLAGWLRGTYEGFDVQRRPIRWCRRSYAEYPNFRFRHLDVANPAYNPGGRAAATELRFPYADASFDFAILASLFTHLAGDAVRAYLTELRRVLRPGARAFATWFLLDPEVEAALERGATELELPDRVSDPGLGPARLASRKHPAAAIAFELDAVRNALADSGFEIAAHWPGAWAGRPRIATWQDVIVAAAR